jgi:PIN domain nuclease of toxin-antitoxin system
MNYLVDTHILIWSLVEPEKLSFKMKEVLLNEENTIYYSQFNLWEISIKYALGKLELQKKTPEQFYEELELSFFKCKMIQNRELVTFYKLPFEHKDPFDRALIWQAINNDLILISSDGKINEYEKYGLKHL